MWSEQALLQMFFFSFDTKLHCGLHSSYWHPALPQTLPKWCHGVLQNYRTGAKKTPHLRLKETCTLAAKWYLQYDTSPYDIAPASEMILPRLLFLFVGQCVCDITQLVVSDISGQQEKLQRTKSFRAKRSWHKQSYKARRGGRVQW